MKRYHLNPWARAWRAAILLPALVAAFIEVALISWISILCGIWTDIGRAGRDLRREYGRICGHWWYLARWIFARNPHEFAMRERARRQREHRRELAKKYPHSREPE